MVKELRKRPMERQWVSLLNQRFVSVGNSRLQVSAAWVFRPSFQHHKAPVLDSMQQLQVCAQRTRRIWRVFLSERVPLCKAKGFFAPYVYCM